MSVWQTVTLGDVAKFVRGITFKPDDVVPVGASGSVACMRTKNVQTELDRSDVWGVSERFVKRGDQFLETGDILVSSANSWNLVGKCCWIPDLPWRATFGGFVAVLRPQRTKVEPRFLFRWFSSDRIQTKLRSFGQQTTNISNLNTDRCLKLPLPLPSLAEQRRIAEVLDRAEALRAKRRTALAQLDTLTQAFFLDLFGDPVSNPKGWERSTLSGCTRQIQIGPFGSLLHQEDYVSGGVPLINPMHIEDGTITPNPRQSVTERKHGELALYHLRPGDVIMGRRGEMGRCAIVSAEQGGMLCGTGSLFIRPNGSKATATYLCATLSSSSMRERLERLSLGATLPNLNRGIVEKLTISLPPLKLQHEFTHHVDAVDRLKTAHRASLAKLDALFAVLQHRAFRGEL